jgi:glutamate-1-semialdehyde 2,1-aminomutase
MPIEQEYVESHPNAAKMYARASAVLPSGVTHDGRFLQPFPIYAERAAAGHKWDIDGREYIDYVMGHGALLLGHCHPAVTEAVAAQAVRGTHYGASHAGEVEWAEQISAAVPSAERVRFTSSGTEATLMALRLARAATGKPAVVKFDRHFHGWHDYVVANSSYSAEQPPGIPQSTLETVVVLREEMAALREVVAGRGDVGAVIIEASGPGSGNTPLPRGFLAELREFTAREGLVMVMDEVVTGFRWSPGGVQQLEGVTPDITTLAKIMAGGLPGGAVAGRKDLLDALAFGSAAKIGHPGTFNANPLSAAAGVACLAEAATGAHQARANTLAAMLRSGLNGVITRIGIGGCAYGQTSEFKVVLGPEFSPGERDWDPRDLPPGVAGHPAAGDWIRLLVLAMLNRGVHLWGGPSGFTSSAHTEADVAQTVEAFAGALAAMQTEGALPA